MILQTEDHTRKLAERFTRTRTQSSNAVTGDRAGHCHTDRMEGVQGMTNRLFRHLKGKYVLVRWAEDVQPFGKSQGRFRACSVVLARYQTMLKIFVSTAPGTVTVVSDRDKADI